MAPIRRYLRITKYSVLEVRIYLDNPALANSWLLNPRAPILPRVIESVRPLVLPKLREEKERAKKKSTKRRAIKDVVVEDDFEVAIFLTETNTRHSLLFKHKRMRDKTQTRLHSNSTKLTGASADTAIDVDDGGAASGIEFLRTADGDEIPILRREDNSDDDDAAAALRDIPSIDNDDNDDSDDAEEDVSTTRRKRPRPPPPRRGRRDEVADSDENEDDNDGEADDDFHVVVDSGSDLDDDGDDAEPQPRRRKRNRHDPAGGGGDGGPSDDKKKMAMDISYEGFAIYGRVLCLVVKRRGEATAGRTGGLAAGGSSSTTARPRASASAAAVGGQGQAMMENWIASTQMVPDGDGS